LSTASYKGRCNAVLAYLGQHPQEITRLSAMPRRRRDPPPARCSTCRRHATTAALERAVAERLQGRGYRRWLRRVAASGLLVVGGGPMRSIRFVDRLPGVVSKPRRRIGYSARIAIGPSS
jgi:hypothetical protein